MVVAGSIVWSQIRRQRDHSHAPRRRGFRARAISSRRSGPRWFCHAAAIPARGFGGGEEEGGGGGLGFVPSPGVGDRSTLFHVSELYLILIFFFPSTGNYFVHPDIITLTYIHIYTWFKQLHKNFIKFNKIVITMIRHINILV